MPPGAQRYSVDAEQSVVTIRVYRAGPLARLGHNHVITSTTETGHAWTNGELSGSGFEVRVPVAGLEVDDPVARAGAGPDFAGEVPTEAREGTRRNLSRAEVLDAERHPEIVVQAAALEGTWQQSVARATVTLKDRAGVVEVPLEIERGPGTLRARGGFRIRQTDFGMTPFSVGGGAIQVTDEVEIAFDVVARAN
jgi:polyisoprenoid-binding protein YceI